MYNDILSKSLLAILILGTEPSVGYFSNRKTNKINLYGSQVEVCSRPGTAGAGYFSGPKCIHYGIDEASHNICLDITTVQGGDFCALSNKEDWCQKRLPCTDNPGQSCPIKNFCVTELDFANYLEFAGGCDNMGRINCEATNMMTILNYEEKISVDDDMKAAYALDCLKHKCRML